MNDRLYRSVDDRVVAGVAGGVADRFDVDPSLVRVAWVILTVLSGGLFLLLYIVMAIVVPEGPRGASGWTSYSPGPQGSASDAMPGWTAPGGETASPTPAGGTATPPSPPPAAGWWAGDSRRHRRPGRQQHGSGPIVIGVLLVLVGVYFLAGTLLPEINLGAYWPIILIVIGAALLVGSIRPGSGGEPDR